MTLEEFVIKYNGTPIDYDKAFGPQCVDVFRQYCPDVCGIKEHTGPCATSGGAKDLFLDYDKMPLEKMNELRKLVNARNAYWKIYGEVNGLGGSRKPDWNKGCYVIFTNGDGLIERDLQFGINAVLAFPTKELCDMFYERFKSEIEYCKELL